jgi:uroporphyrin-3 C-methyltransferase
LDDMTPENDQQPSPTVPPAPPPAVPRWRNLLLPVALVAVVVCAWQVFDTRRQADELRAEVAARLAGLDVASVEERGIRKSLAEQVERLQARLAAVEGKLDDWQAQAAALQAQSQDSARSREQALLLEVEQAIALAGQQLQLAGNVAVATLALQMADARLARLDRPQHVPLRKALAADLARLAAVPVVDVAGASLRLEQAFASVDKLPLAAHVRPAAGTATAAAGPASWWERSWGEIWRELKGLVRIQRFDRDEPALLAPGQEYFARENLKMRLVGARLSLLARDAASYRGELRSASAALGRHFAADDKAVQAMQAQLGQLATLEVGGTLPSLKDTQGALRTLLDDGRDRR